MSAQSLPALLVATQIDLFPLLWNEAFLRLGRTPSITQGVGRNQQVCHQARIQFQLEHVDGNIRLRSSCLQG